ncbi:MAG: site-specific DNA-methyltransferase, partial [Gammaproteobacteria bacterium]
MNMKPNTLYYGDCLEVMRPWPDASVDLIYLDPPFNSKVQYNVLFGGGRHERKDDLAQMTAFSDIWEWDADAQARVRAIDNAIDHPAHAAISAFQTLYPHGSGMLSYLSYMAERLAELRRLLKASGCVYLHCDPTASHYLKILMDVIFGAKNFRNEVVWSYRRWPAKQKNFQKMHDTILRYANGAVNLVWNQPYEPLAESTLQADGGKKILNVFDETGKRKRGVKTGEMSPGAAMRDVWNIGIISPTAKERLDYPTQKPIALLERIIAASSNAGGIVLDPFCGCGTTIDAAHRLRRNWIGIDISSYAIE